MNHDQKIFNRTVNRTKLINIRPKVMRGGTRLWFLEYMDSGIEKHIAT